MSDRCRMVSKFKLKRIILVIFLVIVSFVNSFSQESGSLVFGTHLNIRHQPKRINFDGSAEVGFSFYLTKKISLTTTLIYYSYKLSESYDPDFEYRLSQNIGSDFNTRMYSQKQNYQQLALSTDICFSIIKFKRIDFGVLSGIQFYYSFFESYSAKTYTVIDTNIIDYGPNMIGESFDNGLNSMALNFGINFGVKINERIRTNISILNRFIVDQRMQYLSNRNFQTFNVGIAYKLKKS